MQLFKFSLDQRVKLLELVTIVLVTWGIATTLIFPFKKKQVVNCFATPYTLRYDLLDVHVLELCLETNHGIYWQEGRQIGIR